MPPASASASAPPRPSKNELFDAKALASDQVEWVCHALLMSQSSSTDNTVTIEAVAKCLDDIGVLDELLPSVAPVLSDSPLNVRLSIIAIWYEFIVSISKSDMLRQSLLQQQRQQHQEQQTGFASSPLSIMPQVAWSSSMRSVQDKLLMVHKSFFKDTKFDRLFQNVLALVRVYKSLDDLYDGILSFMNDEEGEATTDDVERLVNSTQDEWLAVFERHDLIPNQLQNLSKIVHGQKHLPQKRRATSSSLSKKLIDNTIAIVLGCDDEQAKNGINERQQSLSLSISYLYSQLKMLLLNWCEKEVNGGELPELVKVGYRGCGVAVGKNGGNNSLGSGVGNRDIIPRRHSQLTGDTAMASASASTSTSINASANTNTNERISREKGYRSNNHSVDDDFTTSPARKKTKTIHSRTQSENQKEPVAISRRMDDDGSSDCKKNDKSFSDDDDDDDFDLPETQPGSNQNTNELDFQGTQEVDQLQQREKQRSKNTSRPNNHSSTLQLSIKHSPRTSLSRRRKAAVSSKKEKIRTKQKNIAKDDDEDSWMDDFSSASPSQNKINGSNTTFSNQGGGGPEKQRHRWTSEEDDAIIMGLRRYHREKNKWSLIKSRFSVELRRRTNVQVKDRARTLEKNGKLP